MDEEPCNLVQITSKKVPITIVTGFLGAGKTTFIQYVLTEKHGKRIAVIENEFGQGVGIEGALLIKDEKTQQQEFIELPNGCLCCTVKPKRNDMLVTIENLVKKKDRFDYIFIEPSGLAHAGTLASNFWVDEALESDVYLDGIVTFVDAKHILQHLNEVKPDNIINEAQSQVAFADRIIINKKDLVSPEELQAVEQRIRQVNADSPIYVAERSTVPLDLLLDIKAFDPTKYLEPECKHVECTHNHENDNHHKPHKHGISHDNSIITVTISEQGSVSLDKFNSWLGNLLWDDSGEINIFRCKGQVSVKEEQQKYVLQGVHTIFTVEPTSITWKKEEPRINRLLLIGRGFDSNFINKSFIENCLE